MQIIYSQCNIITMKNYLAFGPEQPLQQLSSGWCIRLTHVHSQTGGMLKRRPNSPSIHSSGTPLYPLPYCTELVKLSIVQGSHQPAL